MMFVPAQIMRPERRVLLRAALGDEASSAAAYRTWRAGFDLDAIDPLTFRVIPLLLRTAERLDVPDRDIQRMRGVGKHIWLSNLLGMRLLCEAIEVLQRSSIDVLLMKGGALFARDERLSDLRYAGDYDLQIRRCDVPQAIAALRVAGFRENIVQAHRFTRSDFDLIHAVHLNKQTSINSIDLHWRPLPQLRDDAFVDELLAFAEHTRLLGRDVAIPGIADHLFLCVSRSEPWETEEIFLRAVEATLLLHHCDGNLDWDRFEGLVERYRSNVTAATVLHLIRSDVGAPVPAGLANRLWRRAGPFGWAEWSLRRTPPFERSRLAKFMASAFDLARSRPHSNLSVLLLRRQFRSELMRLAKLQFSRITDDRLLGIWDDESAHDRGGRSGEITFIRGFSFPEAGGRWSDGELSIFEVPVADGGDITRLHVFARPFLPHPDATNEFDVTAGVNVEHYRLTRADGPLVDIDLAARVTGGPTRRLVVVFRHLNPGCPLALGLSDDARRLGLFIYSIELPEDIETSWAHYAAREVHFDSPAPSFTRGFSIAETGGRWTDGHFAVLEVPVDSSAAAVPIGLTVSPFIPNGGSEFAFALAAGFGVERYHLNYRQGEAEQIVVNARLVGADSKRAVLVFVLPDARAPAALGVNEDRRLLGLFIQQIMPCCAAAEQPVRSACAP
jgi:hypothetical protein